MSVVEQRAMDNREGLFFGSESGGCQTSTSSYSLVCALSDIRCFIGADREHNAEEGESSQHIIGAHGSLWTGLESRAPPYHDAIAINVRPLIGLKNERRGQNIPFSALA